MSAVFHSKAWARRWKTESPRVFWRRSGAGGTAVISRASRDRREGGFTGWVERRLGIGHDTAYRMISVFVNLGESVAYERHFADLPARVLYALAAPSTPPSVRAEVEQLLIDGQRVTAA